MRIEGRLVIVIVTGVLVVALIQAVGFLLERYGVLLCVLGLLGIAGRCVWFVTGHR